MSVQLETTPEQDALVAETFSDGSHPFWNTHDIEKDDAQQWLDEDELLGLVDSTTGGIVGYVNAAHIERIACLLNFAAATIELQRRSAMAPNEKLTDSRRP